MPNLPQIGIQEQSFRLPIARVPRNPIYGEVRKLSQNVQDQVSYLSDLMLKQKQLIDDKNSLNEYFDKVSQLNESLINETKDPDEKIKLFKSGTDKIMSEIREQYPNMSDSAKFRLNRYAESHLQSMQIKSLKEKEIRNKAEAKAALENFTRSMLEATNEEDRQFFEHEQFDMIHQMATTQIIGPQEEQNLLNKTIGQYRQAKWKYIVANHPDQALGISLEESGVSSDEWRRGQNSARHLLNENDMEAERQKKHEELERLKDMNENPQKYRENPQLMDDLLRSRKITRKDYESIMEARPTNPDLRAVIHDYLTNHYFETQRELDDFVKENVIGSLQLESSDRSYLMKDYREAQQKMNNEQSKHAEREKFNFAQDLFDRVGTLRRDPVTQENVKRLIRGLAIELRHNKDIPDQNKSIERFRKMMYEQFPERVIMPGTDQSLVDAWQKDVQHGQ